jgi:heat-inducible transcriptional repressor
MLDIANEIQLLELDERKQKILRAVVWDYVETAEPVGSENLANRYSDWGVKAATIRNALADLAEQGYLRQPHTSAGRIPSDRGYRFYVDHLMDEAAPDEDAIERTREELAAERADTLDRILRQTCALLTQMTRYTSVATPPKPNEIVLRQVFAAPAGPDALLIVAMLSTGSSEHRILTGAASTLASQEPAGLTQALAALNASLAGRTLDLLRGEGESTPPDDLTGAAARALYVSLAQATEQIARSISDGTDRPVIEGANEILRQPEFKDVAKLDRVLEALQTRTTIFQFLSTAFPGSDPTVVIGHENPVETLRECSVVTAYYYIGAHERGTLGVVGPTRMDYNRAIPAVNLMARSLSELLTRMA